MNQPALGKKINELRKAKGLTQEELVEKCNISVRTLQRIEVGEVTPRSYTLRTIFAALDYNLEESVENTSGKSGNNGFTSPQWLGQFFRYVFDLFNLKTNTMKKISILSVMIVAVVSVILMTIAADTKAQTLAQVKKEIELSNKNFVTWFNAGQVDSIMTQYHQDACVVAQGCGLAFIRDYYTGLSSNYKFKTATVDDVTLSNSMTVAKGKWTISLPGGEELRGEYITEWRLVNKKWMVIKEMASPTH